VWVFAGWQLGLGELLAVLAVPAFGLSGAPTWGRVLGAIFKVVAVLVFGWLLRQTLTFFVFPRSRMEIGARYAILAMMHYLVIALAFVFALEGLGLDTSSLGWFFGAAGVGIGLGLQDVIGNFFSGLIMLVERPIRVGDTVQVADVVGKVQDIRMRGTVIRTFDNTTVLIPNRQMLGERVTNLSYGLGHARVTVQVGVDGDADPRRVQELLLDVARGHADLLADPAPTVWFTNFAASSIDFTLVGFTAKVADRIEVASDLRQEVFGRLRQEGIGVSLPRMDVHLAWPEGRP
jgi:small-conductance mechanosensitive channel